MPTTFILHGEAALTNLPDLPADFRKMGEAINDTVGMDEDVYIADNTLIIDIDTSEASYSAYDRILEAMAAFLSKHGAGGAVFTLEDGNFWVFGPTPLARWQAHFNHLQDLAVAADERLGAWVEANPAPEA